MSTSLVGQRMGAEATYDGARAVAARCNGGATGARSVSIDGEPGLARGVGGEVKVAFAFYVEASLVREIALIAEPDIGPDPTSWRSSQPSASR